MSWWAESSYLRRSKDLVVTDLGDELIIYDDIADVVHVLNEPTVTIWRLLDGKTDGSAVAVIVARSMGIDADLAEAATHDAIVQLDRLELLESVGPEQKELTRRHLIKVAGVVAGAAIAFPAIQTLGAGPTRSNSAAATELLDGIIADVGTTPAPTTAAPTTAAPTTAAPTTPAATTPAATTTATPTTAAPTTASPDVLPSTTGAPAQTTPGPTVASAAVRPPQKPKFTG